MDPANALDENRRLRRTMRDLVALSTLPAVWTGLGPQGIARSLADVLLNTLSLDFVYVRLTDLAGGRPVEVVRSRHPAPAHPRAVRDVLAPLLDAAQPEMPSTIPDPFGGGTLHVAATRFGVGGDHGVLVAGSRNADFPTEQDRLLLGVGANQTAIVVQRRRAEEQVHEQRERLRVTLASIGDAVIATDTAGRVTFMNAVAQELTGWAAGDAEGQPLETVFAILNEKTRRPVENPALRALREGVVVGLANHTVLVARDGTERPIDDSAAPMLDGRGQPVGAVLVFRDVTERRRAEEALARLAAIVESSDDAIVSKTLDGVIRSWNAGAERIFGYTAAEAVGRHITLIIPPERHDEEPAILARLARGERVEHFETVRVAKDGRRIDISLTVSPVRDADGRVIGASKVARDVTDRKRADARVREQEQRTHRVLESITDAFCTFDLDWRFTYVNRQAEVLLGRSRDDLLGKNHWEEYPDTVGTDVERNYRRARAGSVTVAFEFYYPAHDRWYEINAYPLPDGLSVYFRDVSDRKRAEIALRESERRFRTLAGHAPVGIFQTDADGNCLFVNERWCEMAGMTPEQARGPGWAEALHPDDRDRVRRAWYEAAKAGREFAGEYRFRTPRGNVTWLAGSAAALRDEGGRVTGYIGTVTDITQRKQAEHERRVVTDTMAAPVTRCGRDMKYRWVSQAYAELVGRPAGEIVGRPIADVLGPGTFAQLRPYFERVLAGEQVRYEEAVDFSGLGRRWVTAVYTPTVDPAGGVDGWVAVILDVEERRRAEESARFLAEASAALAGVVDYESTLQKVANLAVPHFADWAAVDVAEEGSLRRLAVAHQDPGRVRLAHELMRQYPPDPHAPGGVSAVLRTGKPEIVGEITDDMLVQGAKDEEHLRLIRSLGLKSYICVPLVVSGNVLGALTFATAESGRRYTDADLALAVDLAHRAAVAVENTRLYQALREADRRKDEFLATLAHELRNPLAPVRNALQILKMPRVDAGTAERSREMMERQVQHLVRLVDDLMDVSRVMRGKIELRREKVELATVVARAVETVQPLVDAQGHQLSVRISPESLLLDADPVRLAQVVGNLLTNAAKYTEPRGRIWLTAEREGGTAVLCVRDTGIGITPTMLPRIFELFVQVDHASTKAQGGLGIGLTLVKNLVEMHNGTVEARSEGLGRGSEFVVRLPLSAQRLDQVPGGEAGEQAQEPPSPSGYRLLVVDDNQDAAESLAVLLGLQGHEVRVAFSGMAALEMTKTYTPDVVFLDIGMPGMDGYEVARRLRQQPGLERVVLAALTGWGQQADRRRTAEAGFDHHFVKPPEPQAIENVLSELRRNV